MMLKTLKKKHILSAVIVSIVCGVVTTANATCNPGVYVGGQLGWGSVHQGNFAEPTVAVGNVANNGDSKDTGLAGRVFGGYQFNQNFAAELGYTKFHNATANETTSSTTTPVFGAPFTTNSTASGTVKTDAFDIVGKGIIPLQNGFSIYGKLGAAYLRTSGNVNTTVTNTGGFNNTTTTTTNLDAHKVLPTFGAGASYDITQNLAADVSWMRIQKVGNTKLNNTDFVGAGLTYKFG